MNIGIILEGKVPPDKRVALSPQQCVEIEQKYPFITCWVQKSSIRCFSDAEYSEKGIHVVNDLSKCDVLLGIKEVPVNMLMENKHYFFFSHTIKKQAYNKKLLQTILRKNITLTDYECITDDEAKRLIGFGKYAGIVGAYNGFLTYGKKNNVFNLKYAFECFDKIEMLAELKKVQMLIPKKMLITGDGRVSSGVREILEYLNVQEVSLHEFTSQTFDVPVFSMLVLQDYMRHKITNTFHKEDYYRNPMDYISIMGNYVQHADILFTGHVWKKGNPVLLSNDFFKNRQNRCRVVADITCDIGEPIACTIRPCTIGDPFYYYNPYIQNETLNLEEDSIAVMSVDNLPCELPKDASVDFGNEFIQHILPELVKPTSNIIERATITKNGRLTAKYQYLSDFVSE